MKNYDERTRYILEQRNIRLEKRRNLRGTITAAAGMAGALALVVGTTVTMSGIAGRDGLSSAVVQSGQLAAESGKELDELGKSDIAIEKTDTVEPQLNLPDERIFRISENEKGDKLNFEMSDFPNVSFVVDKATSKFCVNGAEIFSGMSISSLYVADLNGDGYREIVADVSKSSGMDSGIIAYDIKNDELYQLADRFNYNYYTTFYNNEVGYEYRVYNSKCGVPDGSGDLTLDIMTKISGYTPNWEAMTPVLSDWNVNSSLFNTLVYSLDDARVTVFFRMNGEPSEITGDINAAAGYSVVHKTEWLETKDKDGNTIAEFTINDMPIRLTFNQQAKEKLGDVIELAIKTFKQSTVHYDNYTGAVPNQNSNTATPIDVIANDGVPIKSTRSFTEEEKAEILKAYEAVKVFYDKHLNINYPNASKYITSIDDVRYNTDLYSHYDPTTMKFSKPEVELEFWVTCADYPILSSSRKNEWCLVSKIDGVWTTYSECMDT